MNREQTRTRRAEEEEHHAPELQPGVGGPGLAEGPVGEEVVDEEVGPCFCVCLLRCKGGRGGKGVCVRVNVRVCVHKGGGGKKES